MFEVGKKYRYTPGTNKLPWLCKFVGDGYTVLENNGAVPTIVWHSGGGAWEEYIEPKVVVTELTVREEPITGHLYVVGDDPMGGCANRNKGRIRITHTEGQGLAVAVIG